MDSREKTITFDIGKIDFKWVDDTNKIKELKRAYAALTQDGGHYKELEDHLKKKILSLDPKFERHLDGNHISSEEKENLTKELLQWEDQITQQDHELKVGSEANGDIFKNQGESSKLSPLQQKKEAEAEKQKGNDFMRSSDFSQALTCYNKSISLNPEDPATYSNRALAQIKLKDFAKGKQDADKALSLKPDYIKAYHRLAKAYEGLGDLKKSIKSFKEVLKLEPQNKDAPIEIKRIEEKLNKASDKKDDEDREAKKTQENSQENFKRVQIEEDSDDSQEAEDEVEPEEEEKSETKQSDSSRPLLMKRSSSFWEEADTPQEDQDEKKLIAQIKAINQKVDSFKEKAKKHHQKGNYDKALQQYQAAVKELQSMGSGMTKVRLLAQIHNNMAACYKQYKDNPNVRKYATLVIQSDTDDTNLIGKALWRRGLSYYEDEFFQKALDDLEKARSYGVTQNIGMIMKNIRDHLQEHLEEEVKAKPENKEAPEVKIETEPKPMRVEPKQPEQIDSLHDQVLKLKQSGNAQFKALNYSSAIKSYSEAYEMFESKKEQADEEVKKMVKQCLGNRALVYYKQGEWLKAVKDCDTILIDFDPNFKKAILRRGICYNYLQKFDSAVRDLQAFIKLQPLHDEAKKELNKALAGFTHQLAKEKKEKEEKARQEKLKQYEARQKQKEEEERKAQQIKSDEQMARATEEEEKKAKELELKESLEKQKEQRPSPQDEIHQSKQEPESGEPEEETKQLPKQRRKTQLNQELVKQANEKAKEKIGLKKPLPINMFEFNNYWGNLRTESKEVRLQYLKSIPLTQIRKIFKASEISKAHFVQIIDLLLDFQTQTKFTISFMAAISKFETFETLVDIQLSTAEKKKLIELVTRGLSDEATKKKSTTILKKL